MPAKKRQAPKAKKPSTKKVQTKSKTVKPNKSYGQYDTPRNLVIAGAIGLLLFYTIASRALNTGSYWEYLFALIIVIISIRLFIRSLRLK
jgi:hypothetical protein